MEAHLQIVTGSQSGGSRKETKVKWGGNLGDFYFYSGDPYKYLGAKREMV